MNVSDLRDLIDGLDDAVEVVVIDPNFPPYSLLTSLDIPPEVPENSVVLWQTPLNADKVERLEK